MRAFHFRLTFVFGRRGNTLINQVLEVTVHRLVGESHASAELRRIPHLASNARPPIRLFGR
jgi:hypothetical protein